MANAIVQSATKAGPNTVLVQVLMLRTDGTQMHVKQRISVRGGHKPKIVEAQLLSVTLG